MDRRKPGKKYNWKKHVKLVEEQKPQKDGTIPIRLAASVKFFCQLLAHGVPWDRALEKTYSKWTPPQRNKYINNYVDTPQFKEYLKKVGYVATLKEALDNEGLTIQTVAQLAKKYIDPEFCKKHKIAPSLTAWAINHIVNENEKAEAAKKKGTTDNSGDTPAQSNKDFLKEEMAKRFSNPHMTSQASEADNVGDSENLDS